MILPVSNFNNNQNFTANNAGEKKLPYAKDTLLENNFSTRSRIAFDKLTNAMTLYPAKGLKGDKNANFYEFLTMGTVPYLVGSGMLMAVFNSANKHFPAFARTQAGKIGQKMALGVLFYGILKSATKPLVTTPVKWLTGVDTEVPYAKVNYELPDDVYDTDITSIEYHKAFESKEFPRWDLFYKSEAKGENRNEYYDGIAKKLGLGENLKDSDQEVKPLIKDIAIKTDMAKTIASYMWAAAGVCYAFQAPWDDYFKVATLKFWKPKEFGHSLKVFGRSAVDSAKEMWRGPKNVAPLKGVEKLSKHAGKIVLGAAALTTVLGVINSSRVSKAKSDYSVIDNKRKYVVD